MAVNTKFIWGKKYKCTILALAAFIFCLVIQIFYLMEYRNLELTKEQALIFGKKSSQLGYSQMKNNSHVLHEDHNESPGEMGKPVILPKRLELEMKKTFHLHQFNLLASDRVALNRSLPDVRSKDCKSKVYPDLKHLPDTSVIIVFHNEARSTLLRTIHSVIDRSPELLLKEIILVDDFSEIGIIGQPLIDYVASLKIPVKVLQMQSRSGLIKARLFGAKEATGKVLTFLDSHCECAEGWLVPMLYEIYRVRTAVACPIIDGIDHDNFSYKPQSGDSWGAFDWNLKFIWEKVPDREKKRVLGDKTLPTRSPTMAGGLFSINRDYFYEIGSYDREMQIWGSENIEMSFRIWMCHGKILQTPCSHIGHVFREKSPHSFPGGSSKTINRNKARTAEVWMDEWIKLFHRVNPTAQKVNFGDISERVELRKKLQCETFNWYLRNIYPENHFSINHTFFGTIKNMQSHLCLDALTKTHNDKVGMHTCHGHGGNQIFMLTTVKEIRINNLCFDLGKNGAIILFKCHGKGNAQRWYYNTTSLEIIHRIKDKCLTDDQSIPVLAPCKTNQNQHWIIT